MSIRIGNNNYSIAVCDENKNYYKIGSIICEQNVYFTSSVEITYNVDTNISYQEKVNKNKSCLNPTSFTPIKDGYEFVGWRLDNEANEEILEELLVTDNEPITLYAVFKKSVTVYYKTFNYGSSKTQYLIYNNGNSIKPLFTIDNPGTVTVGSEKTWLFRGWTIEYDIESVITYIDFTNIEVIKDLTIYASYYKEIILTINLIGVIDKYSENHYYLANGIPNSGIRSNILFTVESPELTGYDFRGWSTSSSVGASIVYEEINNTKFTSDQTLYSQWEKLLTLTVYNNSTIAEIYTKYIYYAGLGSHGSVTYPYFTITPVEKEGWEFIGFNTTPQPKDVIYEEINNTTFSKDITLYTQYQKKVYLYYKGNESTSGEDYSVEGIAYHNSAGNTANALFTIDENIFTKTGYEFVNWYYTLNSKTVIINPGVELKTADDIILYVQWKILAEPWYLTFTDYPLSITNLGSNATKQCYTGDYYQISCKKTEGSVAYGSISVSTPPIPTKGCNKVRIKYTASHYSNAGQFGAILGVAISSSNKTGTLIFDVSPEGTFTLSMNTVEATAYFDAIIKITEVYFYYE